jgi:hypothetical protein
MQFKALVVLSFLALTGSAQRCLKGNHANQGEGCEGVGNLICSHNYKHVVSDLTPIDPSEKSFAALAARICQPVLIVCDYSLFATATTSGSDPPTVAGSASLAHATAVKRGGIHISRVD